jgi:hypothetical protein
MTMDAPRAFAAVALAAVAWDGVMSRAGARALRHSLDYRPPFRDRTDPEMIQLMNELLGLLREQGAEALMVDAGAVLNAKQRLTVFAVATEIMRSDGPLVDEEHRILDHLGKALELAANDTERIVEVMNILHAGLSDPLEV